MFTVRWCIDSDARKFTHSERAAASAFFLSFLAATLSFLGKLLVLLLMVDPLEDSAAALAALAVEVDGSPAWESVEPSTSDSSSAAAAEICCSFSQLISQIFTSRSPPPVARRLDTAS